MWRPDRRGFASPLSLGVGTLAEMTGPRAPLQFATFPVSPAGSLWPSGSTSWPWQLPSIHRTFSSCPGAVCLWIQVSSLMPPPRRGCPYTEPLPQPPSPHSDSPCSTCVVSAPPLLLAVMWVQHVTALASALCPSGHSQGSFRQHFV